MKKILIKTKDTQSYRNWRLGNQYFHGRDEHVVSLFPDPDSHLFTENECLITSLAIMLRHFGIEKEDNETFFNPWILYRKLMGCKAFDSQGTLSLRALERLYPLDYAGTMLYSPEKLKTVWETGQPFLIVASGIHSPKHFLVPDYNIQDNMAVIDCLWNRQYLSEYERVIELQVYWKSDEGMMYCIE